jgi:ATP-dependent helicase HrpB
MVRAVARRALPRLPIDDVLEDVLRALDKPGSEARNLVLIAPPGAGKTTRVAPALLRAGLAGQGREQGDIIVLQPRRLAARMAAERVAAELGEPIGKTVGYEVRFDRQAGPETRVRFVTEGVLTRKLVSNPELRGTSVVILDEFHERHLAGDLSLAMLRRLQRGPRPDLGVVVMSATLDPGPIARFLENCPVIVSEGRRFPVDITYAPDLGREPRPLEVQVSAALRRLVADGLDGHVLVFLPGAAEIRRAMDACADIASQADLMLVALHGDLSAAEQDRAVGSATKRKVILATNVAETSITIEGVACVIDSGLARVARHSPWSGVPSLRVEPISQASAAQRAGRAGRTGPGRCVRLYSQHDHDTRRPFDAPEIQRADLAEAALVLHAGGVARLDSFAWFEAPPRAAMDAADALLARLGAIDASGALTDTGRRMLRFAVHPRQARMLVEAEDRGVAAEGCVLAALVGEKEPRVSRRTSVRAQAVAAEVSGFSDLIEDLDQLEAARAGRAGLDARQARSMGLDPAAALAVERTARALSRNVRATGPSRAPAPATEQAREQALLMATLAGYPDRVARRRAPGSAEIVFAGGGSGEIARSSVVLHARGAELLVAVEVEERGQGSARTVRVRRASAVDPAWLFELFMDRIRDSDELVWNPQARRVERQRRIYYDDLVIDEERDLAAAGRDPEKTAALLADAAVAAGIDRFVDPAALERYLARLRFAAEAAGPGRIEVPAAGDIEALLRELCVGLSSFAELERVSTSTSTSMSMSMSMSAALDARMSPAERALVDRLAPAFVRLPGRARVPVHYQSDRPPWIESRMQDFFGMAKGPAVAGGRVPLVLHLLAPNQRAVQVTSDLDGFWSRHYPALRRQLMRRYPRHAWPEDPRQLTRGADRTGPGSR